MRFGVNSFLFTDTFEERDLPLLERSRDLGFDVLEITPIEPDEFPARRVRQFASELDMSVNINFALPEEANTISPDPAVRRQAVELSKKVIDLSAEAGAEIYCGANYVAWKYLTGQRRTGDEWNWGVETYRQIAEYARDNSDLLLGVETLNRFESFYLNTVEDTLSFVDAVDMPNVKAHLDTFHMIREEDDMIAAIRDSGDRLGYFHACGSQRGIPGNDMVPWLATFKALRDAGYQDTITIEGFHPDLSIAPLVAVWRDFADSPDQLASEGLAFLKALYHEVYGNANDA